MTCDNYHTTMNKFKSVLTSHSVGIEKKGFENA